MYINICIYLYIEKERSTTRRWAVQQSIVYPIRVCSLCRISDSSCSSMVSRVDRMLVAMTRWKSNWPQNGKLRNCYHRICSETASDCGRRRPFTQIWFRSIFIEIRKYLYINRDKLLEYGEYSQKRTQFQYGHQRRTVSDDLNGHADLHRNEIRFDKFSPH